MVRLVAMAFFFFKLIIFQNSKVRSTILYEHDEVLLPPGSTYLPVPLTEYLLPTVPEN